ncbi:hypothetical protein ACFYVL_09270 [Streptomyces sp. NPDC004111]|uniref:hypothetical protein n=1 Tax=Streptomyces sp. NPDC004111 TaxID=3364690 RepID=UPI0036CF9FB2
MTTPPRPSPPPLLVDDVLALLGPLRQMRDNHQARLGHYRDSDGEPLWDKIAAWEETRRETAIEASDALDSLLERLEQLVADPPLRAHTLVVAGPAHAEVDDWYHFVVNATALDDAARTLSQLPTYRQWLDDMRPGSNEHSGAPYLSLRRSHAGTPAPGMYWDLRDEQARTAGGQSSPRTAAVPPSPPPATPAARRSR